MQKIAVIVNELYRLTTLYRDLSGLKFSSLLRNEVGGRSHHCSRQHPENDRNCDLAPAERPILLRSLRQQELHLSTYLTIRVEEPLALDSRRRTTSILDA